MTRSEAEQFVLLRNQLCFALYTSTRMIVDAYRPILGPLGLSYEGYLAMMVLWEEGDLPEHELSERLKVDLCTVGEWTDGLEQKGYLRFADGPDGGSLLSLTETGRALREDAIDVVPSAIRCRLLMPEQDVQGMRANLEAMIANMDATNPAMA